MALPLILEGNDIILQAQTGSGKTLNFALPILTAVNPSRAAIQAVVIAPTRELGLQIAGILKSLAKGSPEKIVVMSVVEGSKNRRQQIWATAEPPHIIVGNPRSLQRLVEVGKLRLNSVSMVVIDEVDACLISPDTRQVILFSIAIVPHDTYPPMRRNCIRCCLDDSQAHFNRQKILMMTAK